MTPLYLFNGKLLTKNGAIATSSGCCCNNCVCPIQSPGGAWSTACSCVDLNFNSTNTKLGLFPGLSPEYQNAISIQCGSFGPNGETGWLIGHDNCLPPPDAGQGHWELFVTSSASGCCPPNGTYQMNSTEWSNPETQPPGVTLTFYDPPIACSGEDIKCLPKTWQLYDTTNQKVLDYGDILSTDPNNPNETNYILENLEDPFKPWGYYTKNFHVELRIYCEDDNVGEKLWETDVEIGSCGEDRYPEYPYDDPWTRKICLFTGDDPCLYDAVGDVLTISMTPGGKIRSGRVNLFDQGEDREYSNIFNWKIGGVRATYNNDLPDNSTNIEIQGSVLEDGSVGGAVCNDLTINAAAAVQKEFGITINSYGRVLVTGNAHIIDEKYNELCTDLPQGRGHIVCNNTGPISTFIPSDGITYEYDGDIQFRQGLFSGTLEYKGLREVAVTFGGDGVIIHIIDNATIIGGDYVVLRDNTSIYGGYNVPSFGESLAPCEPVYDGSWIFANGCQNRGGTITTSGASYVRFFTNTNQYHTTSTPIIPSTITSDNPVHFYDNSANLDFDCSDQTIVTNDAIFHNNAFNSGKVGGNAEFYDSSYNHCLVSGDATFYNSSYNWYADVLGHAVFRDTSYNYYGGGQSIDYTFYDQSYNDTLGYIGCTVVFNDNSYNKGTILNGGNNITCTFNNFSYNDTTGSITMDCILNDSSYNLGSITGDVIFNNTSYNESGDINGTAIFNNTTYSTNIDNNITTAIYNDTSYNDGQLIATNITFNNSSYNIASINGTIVFNDNSYNSTTGSIFGGTATFNNDSYNDGDINENVTFNNVSINNGAVLGDAVFNDNSSHFGTIDGDATFNDSSCNSGTVTGTITGSPPTC